MSSLIRQGIFLCPSGAKVSPSRAPPPKVTTTAFCPRGIAFGANELNPTSPALRLAAPAKRKNSRRFEETACATLPGACLLTDATNGVVLLSFGHVIFYSFGSCYAGRLCSEQQQPHGALESMNGSSLTLREQTSKQTGGIESDIFFRLYEPELRYFSDVLAFFCTCSGAR